MTERLIVLNLPHPSGLLRELKSNPEQIANSEYARTFQRGSPADPTVFFGRPMTAADAVGMGARPGGAEALRRGVRAVRLRRDAELLQGATIRRRPAPTHRRRRCSPKVKVPVLMFHGLDDRALHRTGSRAPGTGWRRTSRWSPIPGAGHFVQQDAAELVTSTMKWWLTMRTR